MKYLSCFVLWIFLCLAVIGCAGEREVQITNEKVFLREIIDRDNRKTLVWRGYMGISYFEDVPKESIYHIGQIQIIKIAR